MRKALLSAALLFPLAAAALAQDTLLLSGFEDQAAVNAWEFRSGTPSLVAEGVTQGAKALQKAKVDSGQ